MGKDMSNHWFYWFNTDKATRKSIAKEYDEIPLDVWDISTRARNCLLRHDPKMSIGDVLKADDSFQHIRGLGVATLDELNEKVWALIDAYGKGNEKEQLLTSDPKKPPTIPDSIRRHPIEILHLPTRTYKSLKKADIKTIGQLFDKGKRELGEIKKLSRSSINAIEQSRIAILNSINENTLDWFVYWESLGIIVIPDGFNPDNKSCAQIIEDFPRLVKEILFHDYDEKTWIIVKRRFELGGVDKLTLQELGIAFAITRERVRQIENQAISTLREVLINNQYSGKGYRIHPAIQETVKTLTDFMVDEIKSTPMLEGALLADIQQMFGLEPESVKTSLFFLLSLCGGKKVEFSSDLLQPVWGFFEPSEQKALERGIERIHKLLTQEIATPMSEVDILIQINKGVRKSRRFSLEQLRQYMGLCSSVEEYSKGFYWGKFEFLVGRGNQAERILTERGEPIHLREIVREINHRLALHEKRTVNIRSISNQISADGRFCPLARSGKWGLSSWSLDTGTIVEIMRQALASRNEPLTSDEIYIYVSERRPVQKSSIDTYLALQDIFVKIDRNKWGLSTWAESKSAKNWNPLHVGEFIENIFKESRTKILEYAVLRQALMDAANVSQRQAQGLLNINPVIETHRDEDTHILYATYQPTYKDKLSKVGARFTRKKKTLRQEVDETVREVLENAPGQQVALAQLIDLLVNKYHRRDKTFYNYISDLGYIEKFTIPDTGIKMCRLSKPQTTSLVSQVESINDPEVKTKVGRALSFLNENDVDIALFLLSKEFEATLRAYLETAYPNQPFKNLDRMINFVKKEDIITDQAVLHFLRQKRNDRAHGTMPTVEERQVMMKYAEITAGMYIDYIRFFDDLRLSI